LVEENDKNDGTLNDDDGGDDYDDDNDYSEY
jgi:hypothetical protein